MGDDKDYSNWMSNLPSDLQNVSMSYLAIPGSHDSCTSNLSTTEIGPDTSANLAALVKMLKKEKLLYDWSKTQHLSVTEQLKTGIRYFDLRACLSNDDFHITHGLLCGRIVDYLNEVKTFLAEHPREIVMLDFNHFYTMDTDDCHKRLIKLIIETIGREKLCLYVGVRDAKIADLWSSNQQVLVYYQHTVAEDFPELWPSDCITAPWADSEKPDVVMNYLKEHAKEGRPPDQFYVTQGVLSPRLDAILKSFFNSSNLETLAAQISKAYIQWLSQQRIGPNGVNITIIDFVEKDDYVGTVVALNRVELYDAGDARKADANNVDG